MPLLRLLSRVAFICNVCFVLASVIQRVPHPPEGAAVSLVIVLGFLLSIVVNGVVTVWLGAFLITRRWKRVDVPVWLMVVNFLFFVLQIILIIKGDDSFHT